MAVRPSFTSTSTRSTRSSTGRAGFPALVEKAARLEMPAVVAHRPRLARRRGRAPPRGAQGRRQADHRLRGLRRRRPARADEGLRAPDAPRRVERGLREPHQALLARLSRGLLLQAARRLGAPRASREGHRRALRLPLGARLARARRRAGRRTRATTSTGSSRSSGATRRTSSSRTRASPSSTRSTRS